MSAQGSVLNAIMNHESTMRITGGHCCQTFYGGLENVLIVSTKDSSKVDPQVSSAYSTCISQRRAKQTAAQGRTLPSEYNHKMTVGTCRYLATYRSCEDHESCSQCGCASQSFETLLDDENIIRSSGVHHGPRSDFGALGPE